MAPERPQVLETVTALRLASERWRSAGMTVGLVPTMGALHAGHRSLVHRARAECDRIVVSIFVNPAQFGAGEDYARYPRNLPSDLEICARERVDAVYLPAPDEVYPPGFALRVAVTGRLTGEFEGTFRPGHFEGVAVMVAKLLVATRADRAYFGQKDAQQCAVVRRLARDLDTGVRIVVCPTVRDGDGLALSSRNAYLSAAERAQALAIPRGLAAAAAAVGAGEQDAARVVASVREELAQSPLLTVDYVAVVEPESFEPVARMTRSARIQVAARIGGTRLIDTLCAGFDEVPPVPARTTASAADRAAAAG
jgi:pantoate--beta-alanine ligase